MTIAALWLPILVSAIIVFVFSALVWMVFPWHKTDLAPVEHEDAVRNALKDSRPGYYMLPFGKDPSDFKDPEFQKKCIDGPQAFITVIPNGLQTMGPKLAKTFVYYLFIGVICAYFVSRTLGSGGEYLEAFRIAGTVAFVAHGVAFVQDSIWFGRPWSLTAKNLFDALLYGLLTGGVFGWLA